MKVCMVFPFEFPGLGIWEGSRTRLSSLSRGLVSRGVEVHILSKRDPAYASKEFEGAHLHNFPGTGPSLGARALGVLLTGARLMQLAKSYDFDIAHIHMPTMAASVSMTKPFMGLKTLYDTHDWFKLHDELYFNLPRLPAALSGAIDGAERGVARMQDGVAVTTPLLSRTIGKKAGVYVVPNAVDVERFRPARSKFRESHFGDGPVVLFVGSASAHQGLWELLGAVKKVSRTAPDVRLLVVGGGEVEKAKGLASDLGIADRVVFTGPGRVPSDEVPDLINSADVGVSPKQPLPRWHEFSQPLKVLEYMACGKPVVVTPLREQVRLVSESGAGVVAEGFGSEQVAKGIVTLLKRGGGSQGQAAAKYVREHHSQRVVTDALMSAYGELVR